MHPERRPAAVLAVALGTLLAGLAVLAACSDPEPVRATLQVEDVMSGDTAGYTRAVEVPDLRFPYDHGPHPDFKTEWWYFTGNLEAIGAPYDDEDRDFGFQLTLFRSGLQPPGDSLEVRTEWAARQAWMGHFALTDIAFDHFYAFERFERGALGLAGAERDPVRVWIGDWEIEAATSMSVPAGRGALSAFTVEAREHGVGVSLSLRPTQPMVLQGDRGLSQKGPEPGNASIYYSMMRLEAEGTVTVAGDTIPVRGEAWLDREWSTSALSPGLVGWDWFALQLDDGSELMLYRLRTEDGATAPFSAATYVDPQGGMVKVSADDFTIEATGSWTSPRGGRYPSGWVLRVPALDLELEVEPRLADQELDLAFRYWEGAVAVSGRSGRQEVAGKGYVELTGYAR